MGERRCYELWGMQLVWVWHWHSGCASANTWERLPMRRHGFWHTQQQEIERNERERKRRRPEQEKTVTETEMRGVPMTEEELWALAEF